MIYNFPPTKFAQENTLEQQIAHMIGEGEEVLKAETEEDRHLELIDRFHSAETALRIIARDKGNEYLQSLIDRVKEKNQIRNYYLVIDGCKWDGPRRATK